MESAENNPVDYQKPTDANVPVIEPTREAYKTLYLTLPYSRERSLQSPSLKKVLIGPSRQSSLSKMTETEILEQHLSQAGNKGKPRCDQKLTPEQIKKNARKGRKARWKAAK